MRKTTAYKAKDGTIFDTKEKCVNYESIKATTDLIYKFIDHHNENRDDEQQIDMNPDDINDFARHILKNRKKFQKTFEYFESVPRKNK